MKHAPFSRSSLAARDRDIRAPSPVYPPPESRTYRRKNAVAYARRWWKRHNPHYRYFRGNDCTNFISQCVYAGSAPMCRSSNPVHNWWYDGSGKLTDRWSLSWTTAHSLYWFLASSLQRASGLRAEDRRSASDLELGDLISYDWQGDGRWDHTTLVVAFDKRGEPLVSHHTPGTWKRHWRYKSHRGYDPDKTRFQFWHIRNKFS